MNDSESKALAGLLFPEITETVEDYEALYPARQLGAGARVTRFAPSPTGFLHFGNLFTCLAAYLTAKKSGGVFYVRVEDTDQKRRVPGAVGVMLKGLEAFGIRADEGVCGEGVETGAYGPYYQSRRRHIYQTFAKHLTEQGFAYPCFCSETELDSIRAAQENESTKGYWGKWAKCRSLSLDEIRGKIAAGEPWTLRLKSPGSLAGKCVLDDMIKGKIEMPENVQDIVLLKSDGIPTYHFAHVVDDHLMRTTHILRGDEWLPSTSIHLQLFRLFGFKAPKYAHIAPIMKEENGGRRKLSKRKDAEMAVTFYEKQGYPKDSVIEYMLVLANSDFEDWRRANKAAPAESFPFNLKKMSVSGALFDIVKLGDVSKNIISKMTARQVFTLSYTWAKQYNPALAALYEKDFDYATAIFNIDRENKNPRKDIAKWGDIPDYISYMYDETFTPSYALCGNATPALAISVLRQYMKLFDVADDKETWFSKIKSLCAGCGCTPNVKEFKQNPAAYRGHVGDLSTIIRVALTGRTNTPDLFCITALLGKDRVYSRLERALEFYESCRPEA